MLQFSFNESVYYHIPGASYPASGEELGNFVGVADSSGDELTFLVLTKNNQILTRSVLRSAERTSDHNKRVAEIDGGLSDENGGVQDDLASEGIVLTSLLEAKETSELFQHLILLRSPGTSLYGRMQINICKQPY